MIPAHLSDHAAFLERLINARFNQLRDQPIEPIGERWFVFKTEPAQEQIAAGHMTGRGIRFYLPVVHKYQTHGPRRTTVEKRCPMFPGYIFAAPTETRKVLSLPGIHSFLRVDDRPAWATRREIEIIRDAEQHNAFPPPRGTAYSEGDVVRLTETLWQGLLARVVALDNRERIVLSAPCGRLVVREDQIESAA